METGLTKAQILAELTRSPHASGHRAKQEKVTPQDKLKVFVPMCAKAAAEDPEFFAHMVAWNHQHGAVRDAKVALPAIALTGTKEPELVENALAHLADLRPRELVKAVSFALSLPGVPKRVVRRLVERYLRDLEANFGDWEPTAIQHRASLKWLYGRFHIKPDPMADYDLFGAYRPTTKAPKPGTWSPRFRAVWALRTMPPEEIAGTIGRFKLPWLVVKGALKGRLKEPDVLCAIIARLTGVELVTSMKELEKLGVKTIPAARAALEQALVRAAEAKQAAKALLKTSKAADMVGDEALSGKLHVLQERQLDAVRGIEGNWAVLADCSGSMQKALELGKEIAAVLSRLVRGQVHLIFFSTTPRALNVTGQTLAEIRAATKYVVAGGNTSIGCGVQYLTDQKIPVQGIAIVSDGGENCRPTLQVALERYQGTTGIEPTIYLYEVDGDANRIPTYSPKVEVQVIPLRGKVIDSDSIPNLVQTMRVGRYGLLNEVMQTPLATLDKVLDRTTTQRVLVTA